MQQKLTTKQAREIIASMLYKNYPHDYATTIYLCAFDQEYPKELRRYLDRNGKEIPTGLEPPNNPTA